MTAAGGWTLPVSFRLRVIAGHLHAVDRLIAQGRLREAAMQIQAVRAALGAVTSQICRHHALRCLSAGAGSAELNEFLAVFRSAATRRTRRPVRSGAPPGILVVRPTSTI